MYLIFFLVLVINFIVDSESRRKKKGLNPVEYNMFYLVFSTSTPWIVTIILVQMRDAVLESGGVNAAAAASLSVNIMGTCFTYLYESLTVKAIKVGLHGPFMFPLYFCIDLMNVSILLSVELFSAEFFMVVLLQEGMGLCRNCGLYDIGTWLCMKALGVGNDVFPLKSVAFLEELNTIAAVDSVSEIMATVGLLALALGEALTSFFDGTQPCGSIAVCDGEGNATKSTGGVFAVCCVAFLCRFGFFAFERMTFRKVMRVASNIESNAEFMASSVGTLVRVAAKKVRSKTSKKYRSEGDDSSTELEPEPEPEEQSETPDNAPSDSGRNRFWSSESEDTDPESGHAIIVPLHYTKAAADTVHKVTVLMESLNWKYLFHTKDSNIAVEEYRHIRGDTSEASEIYREIRKAPGISRSTMLVKAPRAALVHNRLNPETEVGRVNEVIDGEGTSVRIMYRRVEFPPPFSPRDSVFTEIVREYRVDGRVATLVCGAACKHASKPEVPGVVRCDTLLYANFYEEIGDTGKLTRWTTLMGSSPNLPRLLDWMGLSRKQAIGYVNKSINTVMKKFELDRRNEKLALAAEKKNEEKLNMASTLAKIFYGSKLFLCSVAANLILSIYFLRALTVTDELYEAKWKETGLCNATNATGT
jgi:hypothetical protein